MSIGHASDAGGRHTHWIVRRSVLLYAGFLIRLRDIQIQLWAWAIVWERALVVTKHPPLELSERVDGIKDNAHLAIWVYLPGAIQGFVNNLQVQPGYK